MENIHIDVRMQRVKSEEKKEKYQVRDMVELRGKFSELKL